MNTVYLLGGARTDFKRNLKKEGKGLKDLVVEVTRAALDATGLDAADIQAGVVGNFAGGLFTRQLHVGALLLEADPALRGIPTMHTEAACASGSLAVLTAAQWIQAGFYDCVIAVGAEQQKTMSPAEGSDVLAGAADYHLEKPEYGEFMFPKLFGTIAERYMKRYPSLTEHDLARVAVKNYSHARLNPAGADARHGHGFHHGQHGVAEELAHRREPAQALRLLADHRRRRGGGAVFGTVHGQTRAPHRPRPMRRSAPRRP